MSSDAARWIRYQNVDWQDKTVFQEPVLVVNIVFMVLIFIALGLRLYSKISVFRKLESDDVAAIIGTAGSLALSSVALHMIGSGYGKHLWDGPFSTMIQRSEKIIKELIVCNILHSFSLSFAKTSIIILYNRIFDAHPWFRRTMWCILSVCWTMFILTIFISVFQCNPIDGAWSFRIMYLGRSSCVDMQAYLYASTAVNIFTDGIVVILPIVPITRLRLPKRKKIAVCLLFLVGGFSCASSIIRMVSLRTLQDLDITYTTANSLFWSVIEVNIALICASCPAIRTIFTRHPIPIISRFLCCAGGSDPDCTSKYNRSSYAVRNGVSPGESRRITFTRYGSTTLGGSSGCVHPYEAGMVDDLEGGSEVGSVRELELVGRDIDVEKGVQEGEVVDMVDMEMPAEPERVKTT
ncbi:hypothetical protein TWF106_007508 [Orbilia oligospora]|uniref:Rhodopsin domain-containing protein n=1 Tax=Orbilia oligospora TaxID=2813651 RepID=A0A7C8R1H0_ORBOL|nr:hypothetical protein TWF679_005550 [Orbilia oligospora]KAF3228475.1 hypothetical protein TWF106_007508 [Orbilia oligospora]